MKRRFLCLLTFGSLICLLGCAAYTQTRFLNWQGDQTYVGSGGGFEERDGLEIWSGGTPRRPFEIVGLINQSHYDNHSVMSTLAGMNLEGEIVDTAKANGGDGIIFVSRSSEITGYSTTGYGSGTVTGNSVNLWATAQTVANTHSETVILVFAYIQE